MKILLGILCIIVMVAIVVISYAIISGEKYENTPDPDNYYDR